MNDTVRLARLGLAAILIVANLVERGYVALVPDYPNFGEYRRDIHAMGYASAFWGRSTA
jgi:hypothetical protein